MPLTVDYDSDAGLVRVAAEATPTVDQIEELLLTVPLDPRFEDGFQFLCDCRKMTRLFDSGELSGAVAVITRWHEVFGERRCALLVSQRAMFALARAFAILVSHTSFAMSVFYSEEEALAWLKQPT